jgi:hypothetical protein
MNHRFVWVALLAGCAVVASFVGASTANDRIRVTATASEPDAGGPPPAIDAIVAGAAVAVQQARQLPACNDPKNPPPADATECILDLGGRMDSYWDDSDGVDPFTPGCHTEWQDKKCGFNLPPDRMFGEFCLDSDRIVESNPERGKCHDHKGDKGHPDIFSCNTACRAKAGFAANVVGGCEGGARAFGSLGQECVSARCVCRDRKTNAELK